MSTKPLSPAEGLDRFRLEFQASATARLKELFETKHLYQPVRIEYDSLIERCKSAVANYDINREIFVSYSYQLLNENWGVIDNADRLIGQTEAGSKKARIRIKVPDVKLYCNKCDRSEAFNSISASEFTCEGSQRETFQESQQTVQVFVLSFLCQSCKSVPEVFLIRRTGNKLTLSGRAPIETVDVPSVIPKEVRRFYSDGVVAHQSGQTLAAVFLIRTLIEQWARTQIDNPPNQADQVLDAYMASLPEDFRQRFPSMRTLYGELSAHVHAAKGSPDLFVRAVSQIVEHFDARRLYKIVDLPSAPPPAVAS